MTLRTIGQLPGRQLHPELAVTLKDLELRLGELTGQLAALESQALISLDLGAVQASLETMLDVDFAVGVESDLLTIKIEQAAGLNASVELLGALTARLSINLGTLTAAINVSQIHALSYEGAAGEYGPQLSSATRDGLGNISPNTEIRAAVFASSSAANWTEFSAAVYTGQGSASAQSEDSPGTTTGQITHLGAIPGGALLVGAVAAAPEVLASIDAIGQVVADITITIGLLLAANFGIGLSVAAAASIASLASLALIPPQFSAEIAVIFGLRAALEPVVLQLRAAINGSGIHLWAYDGPLGSLGSQFSAATRTGIAGGQPHDKSHGLVILTDNTSDWDAINAVLKVY